MSLTKTEEEVLSFIAKKGPSWYYELYAIQEIASNKKVLQIFNKLSNDYHYLEVKKEESSPESTSLMGRKRKYYGLTFRGLLYAMRIKTKKGKYVIEPKEAYDLRLKNQAKFPDPIKYLLPIKGLIPDMEKVWPEAFYSFFQEGVADLLIVSDEFLGGLALVTALLTLTKLKAEYPQYLEKFIEGKNLCLSNGQIIKDYEEICSGILTSVMAMFRPAVSKP